MSTKKTVEGLQQVQNVVSTRTTLPIFQRPCCRPIKTNPFYTTDLNVGVRGSCEAHVDKTAQPLPARRLSTSFANSLEREFRSCRWKEAASIRAAKLFKILGALRTIPRCEIRDAKVVTIRQKIYAMACAKLVCHIDGQTRYVLNGVLSVSRQQLTPSQRTDGRLAMAEIELEFPRSHDRPHCPTKAVTELQRCLRMRLTSGEYAAADRVRS